MLIRRSHIFIAFTSTFILGIIYFLLDHYLDGSAWEGIKLSEAVKRGEYCEFINMGVFFRQNMNSYSNLIYFFFGMIIVLTGLSDRQEKNNKNVTVQFPLISVLCGLSLIYLCFGSTFFHASLTWPGQRFDMNGTYSVAISMILLSVYRLVYDPAKERSLQKIFILLFFILVLLFVYLHLVISSTFLLPSLILLVIALSLVNMIRHRSFEIKYAVAALICVIAAFIFRQTDVAKIGCDPHSIWQGHSAWHVLIGACPFFVYLFYRSENTGPR